MSTFLSEVLQVAGEEEIKDLNDAISEMSEKVISLKLEVKNVVENCDILTTGNKQLVDKAENLRCSMENVYERIEKQHKLQLKNSTGELQRLSEMLQETNLALQFVSRLIDIDVCLESSKQEISHCEYLKAAKLLHKLQSLVPDKNDTDLDILSAFALERVVFLENFKHTMREVWKSCIQIEEKENDMQEKQISLTVQSSRLNEIENMMQALNYLESLNFPFKRLATKILKLLLEPIVLFECYVDASRGDYPAVLEVRYRSGAPMPSYDSVLCNLKEVFQFIKTYLNVEIDENTSFMNKLGDMISKEFCEHLIKNCLSHTIPTSSEHFADYGNVTTAIEKFTEFLFETGFLKETDHSILEYAKNVDVLFANKVCQMYLAKAREVMKKDLHEMIEVGPKQPSQELLNDHIHSETLDLLPDVKLSENTFQFPKCQISKSTLEILDIVHEILQEAIERSDFCAVRLFQTARNVFELYRAVVPTQHSKFLETIPQQVALFHNNCMYLAHCLVTLGHCYQDKLPPVLRNNIVTFVDQVAKLRELGASIFLKHMQSQRKQISDIIHDSGLPSSGEECKQNSAVEKAIRQCLRQLELLQTVWISVLPSHVYSKAMGTLLNAFIDELISRVLSTEDIRSDTAVMLGRVFGLVIARAPQVFQDPKEVNHHVRLWQRFQELVLVLGENLKGIEQRWFDGKGPLAHYFTAEEVKKLIKTLFQNTDRRSAVLAHIK